MVVFKIRDSVPSTDIPVFVMYCVNGESGSSLLIESTDSMILIFAGFPVLVAITEGG